MHEIGSSSSSSAIIRLSFFLSFLSPSSFLWFSLLLFGRSVVPLLSKSFQAKTKDFKSNKLPPWFRSSLSYTVCSWLSHLPSLLFLGFIAITTSTTIPDLISNLKGDTTNLSNTCTIRVIKSSMKSTTYRVLSASSRNQDKWFSTCDHLWLHLHLPTKLYPTKSPSSEGDRENTIGDLFCRSFRFEKGWTIVVPRIGISTITTSRNFRWFRSNLHPSVQ